MTRFTRPVFLTAVTMVLGCNVPGPHFRSTPATRLTVEGSTFDVRVHGHLAEAVRINPRYAPRLGPVAGEAAQAMRFVSGCHVTEVRGDAAQVTGLLDCGNGPPPAVLILGLNYECFAVDRYTSAADNTTFAEYDCEAVPY